MVAKKNSVTYAFALASLLIAFTLAEILVNKTNLPPWNVSFNLHMMFVSKTLQTSKFLSVVNIALRDGLICVIFS